jgi:hypothetical protein
MQYITPVVYFKSYKFRKLFCGQPRRGRLYCSVTAIWIPGLLLTFPFQLQGRLRQPAANRSDDAVCRRAKMKSGLPRNPVCWKQRVVPVYLSQANRGSCSLRKIIFKWTRSQKRTMDPAIANHGDTSDTIFRGNRDYRRNCRNSGLYFGASIEVGWVTPVTVYITETLPAFCFNTKMDSSSLLPIIAMMQATDSRK